METQQASPRVRAPLPARVPPSPRRRPVFAQSYGTAHEGGPNSPRVSEAMDLYNNEVGRTIAEDHPDASEQQLAVLVRDALRRGKLVVVDQNGPIGAERQSEVGGTRHHPFRARQRRGWPDATDGRRNLPSVAFMPLEQTAIMR